MDQSIRVFIEYKISEDAKQLYEKQMSILLDALSQEGAYNIEWFEAYDQPLLYVEMFEATTFSHYQRLKELRQTKNHPIFSELDNYIEGGLAKFHCWAFVKKT
ncbi:MFS transporter [Alkalicoccobacillus plakortidis]|uniref:MFS transporter n=1 Tax=Alkalicoccobacillus plakortidis TaxID=444060 RepID=A0ABT0XLH3_9BACI|nr:MFS transporter [Alkalicoccobacillus plakortidis]MCM2676759.1 MFS transporter [Alkalicoccobacillus plakortidis]